MENLQELRCRLKELEDTNKANILQGFFKTGPGEYGEGDVFLGIKVPHVRKLAREFRELRLLDIEALLKSPIHEERLLALLILVQAYGAGDDSQRERVYKFYLKNTRYINNWDLVDLTANHIVGAHLLNKDKEILYRLARSVNMWERRIAIIATFHFIRNNSFTETLNIAEVLLSDSEDLIHKAVGWMLREVGKRNIAAEKDFLKKFYRKMPRTMLRYAIERFPEQERQSFLNPINAIKKMQML